MFPFPLPFIGSFFIRECNIILFNSDFTGTDVGEMCSVVILSINLLIRNKSPKYSIGM